MSESKFFSRLQGHVPANTHSRQYLSHNLGDEAADRAVAGGITSGEKISRSTLEDEARESTLRGHGTPEERFWQRQRGQAETIQIGKALIAKVCANFPNSWRGVTNAIQSAPDQSKESKKEL